MHHPGSTQANDNQAASDLRFACVSKFNPCVLDLDADTHIRLRPVVPRDREEFATRFSSLSNETRYCRCFAHKERLSETELDMLCNVDGKTHVAIAAVSVNAAGEEQEGIGGARYIRETVGSNKAEMAFLITDAWQRRHVGQHMLTALVRHAETQGIDTLRSYLMPANVKARGLLKRVSGCTRWSVQFDEDGALLRRPQVKR